MKTVEKQTHNGAKAGAVNTRVESGSGSAHTIEVLFCGVLVTFQ